MAMRQVIESMIVKANTVTGKSDSDLTSAMASLIAGYRAGAGLPDDTNTLLHNWDFTKSLTDTVGGVTAELKRVSMNQNGLNFDYSYSSCTLGEIYGVDRCYEIDVVSMGDIATASYKSRLLFKADTGDNYVDYSKTGFFCYYKDPNDLVTQKPGWYIRTGYNKPYIGPFDIPNDIDTEKGYNIFQGKTVQINVNTDGTWSIYYKPIGSHDSMSKMFLEKSEPMDLLFKYVRMGSESDSLGNATISGFRVYNHVKKFANLIYNFDYTQSATDTIQGLTPAYSSIKITSNGGLFDTPTSYVAYKDLYAVNRCYEIDIVSIGVPYNSDYRRLFCITNYSTYNVSSNSSAFLYGTGVTAEAQKSGWCIYRGTSWSASPVIPEEPAVNSEGTKYGIFDNTTLQINVNDDNTWTIYTKPIGASDVGRKLLLARSEPMSALYRHVVLGSNGNNSLANATIKGFRVYDSIK